MVKYRLADFEDNKQLIELTRTSGMPGQMALRIDRYPDFFKLNNLRGETKVFVAYEKNKIVGCICVSKQNVFINKNEYPLYYICDFKVAPAYRNQGVGFELTNKVVGYLESQGADFAFLNISKGNKRPFVFFSDRGQYPDFQNIGTFTTFQYIGSKKSFSNKKYKIESTNGTDEILKFLNSFYSSYELANVITKDKIKNSDLYIIKENNKILAVMSLIDTMPMKQNVVLRMPGYLKASIACINLFGNLFNLSKLPKEKESIKMLYIKYLAIHNNDKALISALINFAKQQAYYKSYAFISISMHENDILLQKLPKSLRFTFYSIGMLVSMKNNKKLMKLIKKGMTFRDYSTI